MNRARERGVVAIMIAIALPVIIGMVALGMEITMLLYQQRRMQSAADAAALGGATALNVGNPTYDGEALGIAKFLGYQGTDGGSLTVHSPPSAGPAADPYYGDQGAVEIIITQPQTLALASLWYSGKFTDYARAVASVSGDCVLQLDVNGSVQMSNGATVNLTQCAMAVSGSGLSAFSMDSSAILNAPWVSVVGSASDAVGSQIYPANAVKIKQRAVTDPYLDVPIPAISDYPVIHPCDDGNPYAPVGALVELTQGVYCHGLVITFPSSASMAPGVYIMDHGDFTFSNGSGSLTGTGVTIVLTSSTPPGGYGIVSIATGAAVSLSAPTSGATAGLIFYGDRNAPTTTASTLQGGAAVTLTGAVYLPTETVTWVNNDGGSTSGSTCTELIAGTILLQGNGTFRSTSCPTGVRPIGVSSTLVE